MIHETTGMHELMLGMFLGGMLLAAPPLLIGFGIGAYILQQRRRERSQSNANDSAAE
jgi:hypothetical protein